MATTSPKFTLQALDFLKSLAVAALSQPILVILTSLAAGSFNINWTEQWHLAVASGAAYLIKNFFSGATPPTSGSSATNGTNTLKMVLILVSIASLMSTMASAQSIFKPIPKPVTKPANTYARALVATSNGDSVFTGFRLTGLTILYGISNGYTASNVYAGTGFGWEHDTYSSSTQRWTTDIQIGAGLYAGGHLAPNNLQAATAVGLHVGLLNKQLIIGVLYNLNSPAGMGSHFVGAIGGNAYLVPTN